VPLSVLQLFVLQSLSAVQAPPTSFLGKQPVPGTHRWLLGQPQTSQFAESAWLQATRAPCTQANVIESPEVHVEKHCEVPSAATPQAPPSGHAPPIEHGWLQFP
jgi:hypothetical protein